MPRHEINIRSQVDRENCGESRAQNWFAAKYLNERNCTPIIGAIYGLVGVLAFGIASLIAFVAIVFLAHRIAVLAYYAVVMAFPVVALVVAFIRQPKPKGSNKGIHRGLASLAPFAIEVPPIPVNDK